MTISRRNDLPLLYVLNTPSGRLDSEEMPLVILMHGRGADSNDLADVAPLLDGPAGYRFIFPNAPKPWEAGPGLTFGFSWFDGWPPSAASISASRELMFQFLGEVTKRYPTPAGKIVISGFSQGALMALDVGLRTDTPIAGIAAMSGGLYEENLPSLEAKKNLPVLIVHGSADEVIPLPAARRARQVLERNGLHPEYEEFPMGHHVTEDSMAVVGRFFQRCLE
jgi:phospholipase/carboxylesterase